MVREAHVQPVQPQRRRVRHAGFLLGVGAGALLDATLFHHLLGWHAFVGTDLAHPAEGWLHLGALVGVLGGTFLLWQARGRLAERASGHVLAGSGLLGVATFNLVEGVVSHHILGLHHVNPAGNVAAWDAAFLGASVLVALAGWRLMAVAARIRETGSRRAGARRATGRVP